MMSAALYVCLFLLFLRNPVVTGTYDVTTSAVVRPEMAPPQNLTMITLNTNYTISWDWHQSHAESNDVTFTTQYIGKFMLKPGRKVPKWSPACEETSHRSCDLTALNLHYLGIYVLRVRANGKGHHSKWVQLQFCPDKNASLGPPAKVELAPAGSDLDVKIHDPLSNSNTSMRHYLSRMYYVILYWEHTADSKALRTQMLNSTANLVTLPKLKAWTWYCVSVRSCSDFYNKSSSLTSPQCMKTEGNMPWWQVFLCFLGSLVIFFLVMLLSLCCAFWCYRTIKPILLPPDQFPEHIKQYFCDFQGSDNPRLLIPVSESELTCDELNICAEPETLQIHLLPPEALAAHPSGLEPDSSGRHSRQDSSSSRDSGVYSTGGSSNLQQPDSNQSSVAEKLWHELDLEQVEMQKMPQRSKRQLLVAEKCVVDICA